MTQSRGWRCKSLEIKGKERKKNPPVLEKGMTAIELEINYFSEKVFEEKDFIKLIHFHRKH